MIEFDFEVEVVPTFVVAALEGFVETAVVAAVQVVFASVQVVVVVSVHSEAALYALDTVIDGVTGIYFKEQTVSSLLEAVEQFEKSKNSFDPATIRDSTKKFSKIYFQKQFQDLVGTLLSERSKVDKSI